MGEIVTGNESVGEGHEVLTQASFEGKDSKDKRGQMRRLVGIYLDVGEDGGPVPGQVIPNDGATCRAS